MPKPLATYEVVAQAAEACLAENQEPTLIAIQGRIGGSFSTIKRHLDLWQAKRQEATQVQVPARVTSEGEQFVRELWRVAEAQAQQQVAAAQSLAEQRVALAEQRMTEAVAALERVEQANEQLTAQVAQLQADLADQRALLGTTQAALATATTQRDHAEQRVQAMEAEVGQARRDLAAYATLQGEAAALRQHLSDLHAIIARIGNTTGSNE